MDDSSSDAAAVAPGADTVGDGRVHPGVTVLANRPLWNVVTSFMAEYPYPVYKFYQERDTTIQLQYDYQVGSLSEKGVFFHIATATNNNEVLDALFKLTE